MIRLLFMFGTLIGCATAVGAQVASSATSPTSAAEAEVLALERDLTRAVLEHDVATFERVLSEEYRLTDSAGATHSRSALIDGIRSGTVINETYAIDDVQVRVYGDAAVVTGASTTRWRSGAMRALDEDRFLDVFIRQQSGWRLVASQTTRISRKQF